MTKKSMREIPCDFITIQQSLQQNYIIIMGDISVVFVRFFLCAVVRGDSFIDFYGYE
jgi:hypothetical protein